MSLICLASSSGADLRTQCSIGMLPGVSQPAIVVSGQLFWFLHSFWQPTILEAS